MIKLVNVPELGYDVEENGIGEVCVKGHNIFAGYYENEELTEKILDDDGWFHTGDLGYWTSVIMALGLLFS